jgi:hypothetical protein
MTNCFKITDERFSTDRTDFYDLIFEVQFSRFRFIIQSNDSVIWLEDYYLGTENNLEATSEKIEEIFFNHSFLKNPYWKSIKVISDFQVHTLLAENSYQESKNEEYIRISYPTIRLTDFEIFNQKAGNHVVIFALIKSVNDIFRKNYPEGKFQFTSGTSVGLSYYASSENKDALWVISDSFVDQFYKNPKTKTLICSKTPIRHISSINLTGENLKVFGEITPYSTAYGLLVGRFKNVTVGETPNEDRLSSGFSEIAAQRYFTLMASL